LSGKEHRSYCPLLRKLARTVAQLLRRNSRLSRRSSRWESARGKLEELSAYARRTTLPSQLTTIRNITILTSTSLPLCVFDRPFTLQYAAAPRRESDAKVVDGGCSVSPKQGTPSVREILRTSDFRGSHRYSTIKGRIRPCAILSFGDSDRPQRPVTTPSYSSLSNPSRSIRNALGSSACTCHYDGEEWTSCDFGELQGALKSNGGFATRWCNNRSCVLTVPAIRFNCEGILAWPLEIADTADQTRPRCDPIVGTPQTSAGRRLPAQSTPVVCKQGLRDCIELVGE
jgi:hypothetical protein